jgi:hypothetical protein
VPTGYTSKLHDGKKQTFQEFALDCARADEHKHIQPPKSCAECGHVIGAERQTDASWKPCPSCCPPKAAGKEDK